MKVIRTSICCFALVLFTGIAMAGTPSISITPSSQEVSAGNTYIINITVDPDATAIQSAQADLIFDPAFVTVDGLTNVGEIFEGHGTYGETLYDIDNTNGVVSNIGSAIADGGNVSSAGVLATVTLTVSSSATDESSLELVNTEIAADGGISMEPPAIDVNNGTLIGPELSETTVSIRDVTAKQGESVTVPIMIRHVAGVSGAHIRMDYKSSVVHVTDIVNVSFNLEVDKEIDNDSGYVRYVVMDLTGGLDGDVVFADVTLKAVGDADDTSPLNLTVVSMTDDSSTEIPRVVVNGSFTVQTTDDDTPPTITNRYADPSLIPTDTDNNPGWGETATLVVIVNDESGVASVTVDLSDIGGSATQAMTQTSAVAWAVSTNVSAETPPGTYQLQINATDIYGNSNDTSVSIELEVRSNGDVDGNGVVNLNDATHLARHALLVPGYGIVNQCISDVDGNGVINLNDAIYLAKHALDYPGAEILH